MININGHILYESDDIQQMLAEVKGSELFGDLIDKSSISDSDKRAIRAVVSEGWYEEFDRYDSVVCEHFIRIYEKYKEESV